MNAYQITGLWSNTACSVQRIEFVVQFISRINSRVGAIALLFLPWLFWMSKLYIIALNKIVNDDFSSTIKLSVISLIKVRCVMSWLLREKWFIRRLVKIRVQLNFKVLSAYFCCTCNLIRPCLSNGVAAFLSSHTNNYIIVMA